jgi:hypothetical protein
MNGSRLWLKIGMLTLALSVTPKSCAQPPYSATGNTSDFVYKFYRLNDFTESEELVQWIVQTIPEMVQPMSWTVKGGDVGTLSFNPKLGLLAIRHTPAAHTEIEAFLKQVKTTIRPESKKASENVRNKTTTNEETAQLIKQLNDEQDLRKSIQEQEANLRKQLATRENALRAAGQTGVVPAKFTVPATAKPESTAAASYPIPAPLQQPKHLFHFVIRFEGSGMETAVTDLAKKLAGDTTDASKDESSKAALNQLLHFIIRYEGDGIIDANVVEFMKVFQKMQAQDKPSSGGDPLVGESKESKPAPSSSYLAPPGFAPSASPFGPPLPLGFPTTITAPNTVANPSTSPSPTEPSLPSIGVPHSSTSPVDRNASSLVPASFPPTDKPAESTETRKMPPPN